MVAVQEQAIYDYRSAGKTNGCRKKITGPIQYVRTYTVRGFPAPVIS